MTPDGDNPAPAPEGDTAAALLPLVYNELRAIAGSLLSREAASHTLQPTALVHEAFVRLAGQRKPGWQGRLEFIGVAAGVMRRVLVDHARIKKADKRGGSGEERWGRVELTDTLAMFESRAIDLVALNEALDQLATLDARKARLVELRFFGGLDVPEAAAVMNETVRTLERDWAFSRAWLRSKLEPAEPMGPGRYRGGS